MKLAKRIKTSAGILSLSLVLAGTIPAVLPTEGDNAITVDAAKAKIKLNTTRTYLLKGKTKRLRLSGASGRISWSSSSKTVATVDKNGVIYGRKAGTAVITAKYKNKSYKCRVTVETPKISKSRITIIKGKNTRLRLLNTRQKVKWTSSNKKIATVTSNGTVKGIKPGKATIYAAIYGKKYKCSVTIKNATSNTSSIFKYIPDKFIFSSGIGAWATGITLREDGSFSGQYTDSDMGDRTVYTCTFSGKFTDLKKIDDYTYSMKLDYLKQKGTSGDVSYKNGTKYVVTKPYGLVGTDEFRLYLPGISMSKLPDGYKSWLSTYLGYGEASSKKFNHYGIYNVDSQQGFFARKE